MPAAATSEHGEGGAATRGPGQNTSALAEFLHSWSRRAPRGKNIGSVYVLQSPSHIPPTKEGGVGQSSPLPWPRKVLSRLWGLPG